MKPGLIQQLTQLVMAAYGSSAPSPIRIRDHLLNVMEQKTYFIEVRGDELVGYIEWKLLPGTNIIHITELLVTQPGVIWRLKKRLYAMSWSSIMFRRHKTNRWRYHRRPRAYV